MLRSCQLNVGSLDPSRLWLPNTRFLLWPRLLDLDQHPPKQFAGSFLRTRPAVKDYFRVPV